eukprot:COSAG02_NODE_8192_length_2667_cov_3.421729_1_plen_854_part_10
MCLVGEDDCDPYYATCHHLGPGQHDCTCHVGWEGDGHTCSDINECGSSPCENGGTCSESSCEPSVYSQGGTQCLAGVEPDTRPPVDAYRCNCVAGFANGMCAEGWNVSQALVDLYEHDCTKTVGGHCDIDINECVSSPCDNGAGCTDSRGTTYTDEPIQPNAFSCACTEGYANGVCTYDFIQEFATECSVSTGGTCDLDVDECASNPCQNGAECSDSTTEHPPVLPPAGMSPGNPAQSCEEIQSDGFYTKSGRFYVKVGLSTNRVWCDLERIGGGWTLLLKTAADSSTFEYDSPHWSTDTLLNEDDVTTDPTDAKYAAFNRMLATEFLAVWPEFSDDFSWRIGPFEPNTALNFFNRDDPLIFASDMGGRGVTAAPEEFNQAHFSYASGGNFQYGVNLADGVHTSVRWGFSWSSPDDATLNEAGSGIGVFGQSDQTRISSGSWGSNLPSASGATEERYSVQLFGRYEQPATTPSPWTEFLTESFAESNLQSWEASGDQELSTTTCGTFGEILGGLGVLGSGVYISKTYTGLPAHTALSVELGFVQIDTWDDEVALVYVDSILRWSRTLNDESGAQECGAQAAYLDKIVPAEVVVAHTTDTVLVQVQTSLDQDANNEAWGISGLVLKLHDGEVRVPVHQYTCACEPGFANGLCTYGFISEYLHECNVVSSRRNGNCDIDVNECDSNPCMNGADCTDSTTDSTIGYHAYRCNCDMGFANGQCQAGFLSNYTEECTVAESSVSSDWTGNCDIDVNECASNPCQNSAECSEPPLTATSYNSYTCACTRGYANGDCVGNYIEEYATECTISESDENPDFGGNCDVDVNECASNPCQNGATCTDSTTEPSISIDAYQCTCV